MENFDYSAIGQRIKTLRKAKGWSQSQLAAMLDKSLRTIQKYETGEIEVSVAVVNRLAEILDVSPVYILGYESNTAPISSMADILDFLFRLEQVSTLNFDIDVQKPPHSSDWTCAIRFHGQDRNAVHNTDMCLILEQWEEMRKEVRRYYNLYTKVRKWQEQTIAHYAKASVECVQPKELEILEKEVEDV